MRFGEALVEAGALNRDQLAKALEMQKILGGRLGSNLLELGMVDENTLLDHLGRFRATQTVRAEELKRIPAPVLRSIPRKLALRYRLIPYQVRGKTLYVASKDPGDALQEDEISFLTSFMVRTHLALEFHLDVALHRYFKSPLDQRFVALTRRLAAGSTVASSSAPSSPPPSSPPPSNSSPGAFGPSPGSTGRAPTSIPSIQGPPSTAPPSVGGGAGAPTSPVSSVSSSASTPGSQPTSSQAVPSAPPAPRPAPSTLGQAAEPGTGSGSTGPQAPFRNLSTPEPSMEFIELDADDLALLRGSESGAPAEIPQAAPTAPAFGPGIGELLPDEPSAEVLGGPEAHESEQVPSEQDFESDEPFGMPEGADLEDQLIWASRELQAADIRDEIGDVLLEFASAHYRRRALVIRRKDELVGWMASGEGLGGQADTGSIRELSLAGSAPSVFFGLQEAGSFWLGPLPLLPANRLLIEALGDPAPKDCLVLPISLRSKIVGYLYADNLDDGVAGTPVAEMKRLVAKAGLAFEVYILKNKIRMM